jgi:hypothetical protein
MAWCTFISFYPIICLERIKQTTQIQSCLPPDTERNLGNPKSREKTEHTNSFSVIIHLQKAIKILLGSHSNKTTTTFVDKLAGEYVKVSNISPHITTDSHIYFTNDFFVLQNYASRCVSFDVTEETVFEGDDTKPMHYM